MKLIKKHKIYSKRYIDNNINNNISILNYKMTNDIINFYNNNTINITRNTIHTDSLNLHKFIIKNTIPYNIYQTWGDIEITDDMRKAINMIKTLNPEFNYNLYNDTECYNFIKANFDESVANAFESIIPGAYKADLWRYCILYINGGIYVDIKFIPVNNFKFITLLDKNYYVLDLMDKKTNQFCIYNGLIISQPKNNILMQCINKIVDNVKNKYYGINILSPTGPGLLGKYYLENNSYNNLELFMHVINYRHSIIYKHNIILEEYPTYRKNIQYRKVHYGILWKQHAIYK